MINNMGQNNNSYYLSQSGPNQMNSKISQGGEPDYSYNINIQGNNNPLLSSVNTIGSKKEALSNIKKHNVNQQQSEPN